MDYRVGGSSPVGALPPKMPDAREQVEAKVLAVREARHYQNRTPAGRTAERRQNPGQRDPRHGRVLVLLIPEGRQLPAGLDQGDFRVFLRFARR